MPTPTAIGVTRSKRCACGKDDDGWTPFYVHSETCPRFTSIGKTFNDGLTAFPTFRVFPNTEGTAVYEIVGCYNANTDSD